MRATYTNVKKTDGLVCGVQFATATANFAGTEVPVTDRLSKFELFAKIAELQGRYCIPESDVDELLLLMKSDASQAQLESEIE